MKNPHQCEQNILNLASVLIIVNASTSMLNNVRTVIISQTKQNLEDLYFTYKLDKGQTFLRIHTLCLATLVTNPELIG